MTTEHVFPQAFQAGDLAHATGGLTLRDYFAVHASHEDILHQAEIIRATLPVGILPDNWPMRARYMHADAMLKAREAT